VIASVEVITATKGILIDAALRTAAEAITNGPISAIPKTRGFVSFPSSGSSFYIFNYSSSNSSLAAALVWTG
jgi:hypothetical protein